MFNPGDIIGGHTICLKALVGSHNYNLNTPESDKDYKYFVWPTFDDLYENKTFHKEVVTDIEDYTIHDVRMLPTLFWKANLNFLEILYSQELEGNKALINYLMEHREELSTMNMHGLYAAAMGMSYEKEKLMTKDSPARHEAIEKYGYDPKSACHALRVLDFLVKYYKTHDMAKAFWYPDGSCEQELMLDIKKGSELMESEIRICFLSGAREVVNRCADFYNKPQNKGVYEAFQYWLKEAVRTKID